MSELVMVLNTFASAISAKITVKSKQNTLTIVAII